MPSAIVPFFTGRKAKQHKGLLSAEEAAVRWLAHLDSPYITEEKKGEFFSWLESSVENQLAYFRIERLSRYAGIVARCKDLD